MIKKALVLALFAAVPFVWGQTPPPGPAVAGEVLETRDVESYTYLRLKTAQGETWAAVPTTTVKKGAKVAIENPMVMNNFQSKALKKTFDKVVFGTLAGQVPAGVAATAPPHPPVTPAPDTTDIKVAKAAGADARTVEEILAKGAGMKDKSVLVRGKIVKINPGIRGVNWVHLRDGTGSAANQTNDLIVTTTDELKVGDVVTLKGVVHTDMDLGAGYAYKVLVEEGKLQR
jgi:hypothetical protein